MSERIVTVTLNPCIDKTIAIEGFEYGGLNRVKNTRVDVGGKGINVSKVLRSFGADVLAFGIAAGKQGQQIIRFLEDEDIPHLFIQTEGETRTNYKILDIRSRIITEINEQGFNANEQVFVECIRNITTLLPDTKIMVLSGSVPSGLSSEVYKTIIETVKEYDVKVILDSDGEKLRLGIEALPYAIKPNIFEFEQLTGKTFSSHLEIASAAKEYIKKGIKLIVVSMGSEGALFISDKEVYLATPFTIDCKSTVGAGDSVVAAVTYGLIKGYDLEIIARMSTAAGSLTASKEGSLTCSLEEVQEMMDMVQIRSFPDL
jgi:1-phosphofructokinase